jgi:PD-(D/E)XK nuclease superfamily protein
MRKDSIELQRLDFEKRQEMVQVSRGTKKRGELAEMAFVYKAASLGFGVARPYGDSDRFDFLVFSDKRIWRVQVKSSSAMQYGAYLVNAQRNANGRAIPYTPDEIDFLVAHIVPEGGWFVIPVTAFTPRRSIRVYPKGDERTGRYEQYREAWCLME